jgi:hypothetical protein
MNDWKELEAILQKLNYSFINDHAVMFARLAPGFMLVDSPWPGYLTDNISLAYLCNNASEFFDRLGIKNASQIDRVKPETLLDLFFAGEVILTCSLNEDENLEFIYEEEKLIATKEDNELVNIVEKPLVTPEDFIEYTNQYFLHRKMQLLINK